MFVRILRIKTLYQDIIMLIIKRDIWCCDALMVLFVCENIEKKTLYQDIIMLIIKGDIMVL